MEEDLPINLLRNIVREVEMIPGVVELPATNLQKRVVKILVDADEGGS